MDNRIFPLTRLSGYETVVECLKKGKTAQVTGCMDSQQVHFIKAISDGFKRKVIVTFDAKKAQTMAEDLRGMGEEALVYPAKDFIFFTADARGNEIFKERQKVLLNIIQDKECTIILTFDALMDKVLPMDILMDNIIKIETGQTLNLSVLERRLVNMGYEALPQVEQPGQFAVRGSIIDIYTLDSEFPYRIDMWDDEVDIIKSFDIGSQRALEKLDVIEIAPASEYIISNEQALVGLEKIRKDMEKCEKALRKGFKTEEANRVKVTTNEFLATAEINIQAAQLDSYVNYFYDNLVSFVDYLNQDTLFIIDEPRHIKEHCKGVSDEFKESMTNRLSGGYIISGQSDLMWTYSKIMDKIRSQKKVIFTVIEQNVKEFEIDELVGIDAKNVSSYNGQFEMLVEDIAKYKKQNYAVLLLSPSKTRGERLAEHLLDNDLMATFSNDLTREIKAKEIVISVGNLHKGFEYPDIKFVVISESDIFGTRKKKKRRKKFSGSNISDFSDLKIGDYVVHENHGIGIYRGIEKVTVDYVIKDYLKIEYDKKGFLYVATTQLNMIQKYAGADAKAPKLNSLGAPEWIKTRNRVKRAVDEVATELVELYAKRRENKGYVYGPDTIWQKEFEEMFPYDETEDQLTAIEAVKADMESTKIMDRLICGDVGFGKTEVAIRAAFKAVQEGKQVAYLVPTTVLAQQHYNTFTQRFKEFPVRVDLLSRFRTKKQVDVSLKDLKKGAVDVVIGTHRLLSKDVEFSDLGLLIIDEEQRFGVKHKEKIKQMKENVDVMSLTATPIPRTLHMSLIGVRDMSIMEEAPSERMPIQTYVMEQNDEVVREAIKREINRGGQVYYIYNNVATIADAAGVISKLVPEANVAFAHGQMSERMIEGIMYDFVNGDIDVLVSTTIVETGIDISNVNTIIIHDADKLGLSQLYQLRGRVGRSNKKAYAFMLYRRDKILKEVAEKRLEAIRDFSELGAGFKIAMRDLEIRGAGNLLGAKQSGHLEAVGYDLYCKMLNEAVALKKGLINEEKYETGIDLDVDAHIPDTYISDEYQKLDIYKRIATISTKEEYEDMQDELLDRFGDIPFQVENLLKVALLKGYANGAYITDISGGRNRLSFALRADAKLDGRKLSPLVESFRGAMKMKIKADVGPTIVYTPNKPLKGFDEIYDSAMEIIEKIENCRIDT